MGDTWLQLKDDESRAKLKNETREIWETRKGSNFRRNPRKREGEGR